MDNEKTSQQQKPGETVSGPLSVTDVSPMVELALAATAPCGLTSCPAPEDLAALSEGKLQGAARSALLDHLDRCDDCREAWLLANDTLDEQDRRPAAQPARVRVRWRPALVYAAPLALAASILLAVVITRHSPYEGLHVALDQAYLLADRPRVVTRSPDAALSTWDSALAQATRLPDWTPLQRSYAAGSLQARLRLFGPTPPKSERGPDLGPLLSMDWDKSPDTLSFLLGSWRRLLAGVCSLAAPLPAADKTALLSGVEQVRTAAGTWSAAPAQDLHSVQDALTQTAYILASSPSLDCGALRQVLDELDATLAPIP